MPHQGNDVNPLYSPHKLMEFHNYSTMSPYICYVDLCQGLKNRGLPISSWSFRSVQLPILDAVYSTACLSTCLLPCISILISDCSLSFHLLSGLDNISIKSWSSTCNCSSPTGTGLILSGSYLYTVFSLRDSFFLEKIFCRVLTVIRWAYKFLETFGHFRKLINIYSENHRYACRYIERCAVE